MTTTDFLHTRKMVDDLIQQQLQAKYDKWIIERSDRNNTKYFELCSELFKMCLTEDGKHVLRENDKLRRMIYEDAKECRFYYIFNPNDTEFELATYKLVYVIERIEWHIKAVKNSRKGCCLIC